MRTLTHLIETALLAEATDLHLQPNQRPFIRKQGQLSKIENELPLKKDEIAQMARSLMKEEQKKIFEEEKHLLFMVKTSKARLRVAMFRSRRAVAMHIRLLPINPLNLETAKLPQALSQLANLHTGLVFVSGPIGSGKTTILRAMQQACTGKTIASIEKIIEIPWIHPSAMLSQFEIDIDGNSALSLLSTIANHDFNHIYVPMEHTEAFTQQLVKAATSSLVIVEIDATSELDAIQRFLATYPTPPTFIELLANVLKAVICIQRVPTTSGSLQPVLGITVFNRSCLDSIRQNRLHDIEQLVRKGQAGPGSLSRDEQLSQYLQSGTISFEDAILYAQNPASFRLERSGILHAD